MNQNRSSSIRKAANALCMVATLMALLAAGAVAPNASTSQASSHREAPLISLDATIDPTDVYAFVSPDITNTVTLISNWIPFEDATGGPNFYHFDPNAHYYIHVDRDGDAVEDISWQWTFSPLTVKNNASFLYNLGPVNNLTDTTFNLIQTYTVTEIVGNIITPTSQSVLVGNKLMPPNNVGPRSTFNYGSLTTQAIYSASGGYQIFTGQRDDPFFVDIGSIFDLGSLRPFNSLHLLKFPPAAPGIDSVGGYNIHTTAIQMPKSKVAPNCSNVITDTNCVVGVWTASYRPKLVAYNFGAVVPASTSYQQVGRLGNPLVNEAVLPLALKDAFNSLPPSGDTPLAAGTLAGPGLAQLFVSSVLTPELQQLLPVLYPGTFTQSVNLPAFPRSDLFTIFLTGIPGVNAQTKSGNPFADPTKVAAETLRLNVAIAPTAAVCKGKVMGAIDGDLAGFPNGRRLEDDVTDIAIRAVAGGYGPVLNSLLGLPNLSPGNLLTDGVQKNDRDCLPSFPYMAHPHSGYDDAHPNINYSWIMPIYKNSR
jgi:hypothetical protein